jgi:DNA-binding GntR family transcriptional regulator
VIRRRISLLDYLPGQRLSEEVLADEFGTSRTPVRRVLARLESEGLLRSVQSVGTIVTDVDIDTLAQTYRLRMELAEMIGRLDPAPVTDQTLATLRAILSRFEALGPSPEFRAFAQINIDFFHAIMNLTRNQPLREISERLYYRTARIWIKSIRRIDLAEEIAIFRREVMDILAAVETGDLEAVGHIRRAHISMSFQRLRKTAGVFPPGP